MVLRDGITGGICNKQIKKQLTCWSTKKAVDKQPGYSLKSKFLLHFPQNRNITEGNNRLHYFFFFFKHLLV